MRIILSRQGPVIRYGALIFAATFLQKGRAYVFIYILIYSRMQKITPPRLKSKLTPAAGLSALLSTPDNELTDSVFDHETVEVVTGEFLSVGGCRFDHTVFKDCRFHKSQFSDVLFSHCDLSNIRLTGCGFHRVEFIGCKLTGTDLSDSIFNQVVFNGCRAEYLNLSEGKLRHLSLVDSLLRGAAFDRCQLTETEFLGCNLTEAEFHRTPLKGIDLSTCDITGIRVGSVPAGELRGAVVNSLQALELARLLGIQIHD